ncbi:MAG: hypothetical protein WA960_03225 [Tunicatimonas sp.]
MIVKAFRDWKFEEVELTFGIEQVLEHPVLTDWLSANAKPSEDDNRTLESLRNKLSRSINTYNEEELKVFFIGPLLSLVPFEEHGMRPFMDRPFSFEYGQDKLGNPLFAAGRIDWLLAKGRQDPREPRVFLHEYKREVEATGDPLGQLLIAMVGSQRQNIESFPLYGCYVLGRNWFLVVLYDKEYAVSRAFDATQEDIFQIYSAMAEVQQRVAELVA